MSLNGTEDEGGTSLLHGTVDPLLFNSLSGDTSPLQTEGGCPDVSCRSPVGLDGDAISALLGQLMLCSEGCVIGSALDGSRPGLRDIADTAAPSLSKQLSPLSGNAALFSGVVGRRCRASLVCQTPTVAFCHRDFLVGMERESSSQPRERCWRRRQEGKRELGVVHGRHARGVLEGQLARRPRQDAQPDEAG